MRNTAKAQPTLRGAMATMTNVLALALIIHGTSGWLVSMDGLGCGVALAG